MMKKTLIFFALFYAFYASAVNKITLTVTVTNAPADGNTFTLNADVRTWAAGVVDPGIQIEEPASIGAATTNLFLQIAANPISRVVPRSGSESITLVSPDGTWQRVLGVDNDGNATDDLIPV